MLLFICIPLVLPFNTVQSPDTEYDTNYTVVCGYCMYMHLASHFSIATPTTWALKRVIKDHAKDMSALPQRPPVLVVSTYYGSSP